MKRVLLLLAAYAVLTGCQARPYARELESVMLVQVLGVDWSEGRVELTAASEPGADGAALLLSAAGEDLEAARAALQAAGEEYVSLTHVTQIVLGAQTDLRTVLEAALVEPALSQSATVWLAQEGCAKELLEAAEGGAKRLSSIELNSGVQPVTVLQSLMRLEETGRTRTPQLKAGEYGLEWCGTAVWEETGEGR